MICYILESKNYKSHADVSRCLLGFHRISKACSNAVESCINKSILTNGTVLFDAFQFRGHISIVIYMVSHLQIWPIICGIGF